MRLGRDVWPVLDSLGALVEGRQQLVDDLRVHLQHLVSSLRSVEDLRDRSHRVGNHLAERTARDAPTTAWGRGRQQVT